MKYAIMICLDGKDDWIYVTEDRGECDWVLKPLLFDNVEDALKTAMDFVVPGKEENVQVVNYEN